MGGSPLIQITSAAVSCVLNKAGCSLPCATTSTLSVTFLSTTYQGASGQLASPPIRNPCHAKIRYRQADQPCEVSASGAKVQVSFISPQRAVTPGQSVVFYEGDICLGGGVIEAAQ